MFGHREILAAVLKVAIRDYKQIEERADRVRVKNANSLVWFTAFYTIKRCHLIQVSTVVPPVIFHPLLSFETSISQL